jgi:hypothetical protein
MNMNQYQSLRTRSMSTLASDAHFWNRSITRRIVELLVRFHPSLTEQDRNQATPVVFTMLGISLGATASLVALIIYLMS